MQEKESKHPGRKKLEDALIEVSLKGIDDMPDDGEEFELSPKCKKGINRIFREIAGEAEIPYPEADTAFERIRSDIVRKLKKKR